MKSTKFTSKFISVLIDEFSVARIDSQSRQLRVVNIAKNRDWTAPRYYVCRRSNFACQSIYQRGQDAIKCFGSFRITHVPSFTTV